MANPWEKYGAPVKAEAPAAKAPWEKRAPAQPLREQASTYQAPLGLGGKIATTALDLPRSVLENLTLGTLAKFKEGTPTGQYLREMVSAPPGKEYLRRLGIEEGPELPSVLTERRESPIKYLPEGGVEYGESRVVQDPTTLREAVGGALDIAAGAGGTALAGKGLKAMGKAIYKSPLSQIDEMLAQKGKRPLSEIFFEEGLTPTSQKDVVRKTEGLLKKYGAQKERIAATVEEKGLTGNIDKALERAQGYVNKLKARRDTEGVGNLLQSDIDDLTTKYRAGGSVEGGLTPPATFRELGGEKAAVSRQLSPEQFGMLTRSGLEGGYKKAKGAGLLEEQARLAEMAESGLGAQMRELGQRESALITAGKRLKGGAVTEAGKLPITQVDLMAGAVDPSILAAKQMARLGMLPGTRMVTGRGLYSLGAGLEQPLVALPSSYLGLLQGE